MAKFISVFLATLQYALGWYIFKRPEVSGCGPLLASLSVLFALSLILWNLTLYPRRLRKLISGGNGFAQYIIAVFLIEYIMGCFWFPLEAALLSFLPKMANSLEESLMFMDVACQTPCEILRREGTGMFISYMTSFLILVAAMHATRVINLYLLSSGISPFLQDINRRFLKFYCKCIDRFGVRFRGAKTRRTKFQDQDDDLECDEDYDPVEPPISDNECPYSYR